MINFPLPFLQKSSARKKQKKPRNARPLRVMHSLPVFREAPVTWPKLGGPAQKTKAHNRGLETTFEFLPRFLSPSSFLSKFSKTIRFWSKKVGLIWFQIYRVSQVDFVIKLANAWPRTISLPYIVHKIQPDLLLRFVGSGVQNTSFPTHQPKSRQKFEHRCMF